MIHVVCDAAPDIQLLNTILLRCPSAIVYVTPEYVRLLEKHVGGVAHWLIAYAGNEPLGFLPFMVLRVAPYGLVINSLPFHGTHGGCLVCADAPQDKTRQALLHAFKEFALAQQDFLSASVSLSFIEHKYATLYAEVLQPDAIDTRRAQICTLPAEPIAENILSQHKTPRIIRKALRQEFSITRSEEDTAWETLHTLQAETAVRRSVAPKTRTQIFAFRDCLHKNQRALWCAHHQGKCIATMLLTLHKPWVHYAIPAFNQAYSSQQPLTALIFTAMCYYTQQGYEKWSFGGTPLHNDNLHHFKASWGAKDASYCYMSIASIQGKTLFAEKLQELVSSFQNYYIFPF